MPQSESTVLLRIARLVFDEAVLSSVVHPTIADLQEELRAAGSSRRRRLTARWRGYRAFWTLVLLAPVAFDGGAVRPRGTAPLLDMVGRAAVSTVVALVVITLWLEAGILILASATAGYMLTALVVHTWHSRRPVRVAVPHEAQRPEINLAAIPVRADMGGVLFALSNILIVVIGVPMARWFIVSALIAGLALAWGLIRWHASESPVRHPVNSLVWR
jgi:hypothetical protein